jgi:hypothetical protein
MTAAKRLIKEIDAARDRAKELLTSRHPTIAPEKINGFMNALVKAAEESHGHVNMGELVSMSASTSFNFARMYGGDKQELQSLIKCVAEALGVSAQVDVKTLAESPTREHGM